MSRPFFTFAGIDSGREPGIFRIVMTPLAGTPESAILDKSRNRG